MIEVASVAICSSARRLDHRDAAVRANAGTRHDSRQRPHHHGRFSFTIAEAVAIADGRLPPGHRNELFVDPPAGGRRNHDDRLARPHRHPRARRRSPARRRWGTGVDLSRARSLADVTAAVASRVRRPAGDVIVSNSDWHEAQLKEQRLPLRDDLDRVAPNNPVILIRGGHEYILNSAALSRSNVDEKTAEPAGGRITRYSDGRLNGELVDTRQVARQASAAGASDARSADRRSHRGVQEAERSGPHHGPSSRRSPSPTTGSSRKCARRAS